MPENAESESMEYIRKINEQNTNHIVRHDEDVKGTVNIEARTDGKFDVRIHGGTEDEARIIEGVSKDKLMKMMEQQL